MIEVRIIPTNIHGQPVGESHFLAYPDSVVEEARALRAQGWTLMAIAAKLGPHFTTVGCWVRGERRKPAVKVVARRVKTNTPLSGIGSASSADKGLRVAVDSPTPSPTPESQNDDFSDLA